MKMTNLDDTFNITPTEVSDTPEGGCTTRKDQLTNVTKPDRLTKTDIDKDYEYTRGNLYSIIEKGQEAINGILELAQESEMPRAYEVAGQLIKSVSDATDKLMDLQKKLKDVEEETKVKGPSTVNNALFVGSTAELGKLLKNGIPKEDK
jgi:dTDP-D-glucose 4,6-dehydratase